MKKLIVISVFLYFLLASIYITFPLIFHLQDYINELGDELLISWIMAWDIHAFVHNPLQIFNANIFSPYHNTLAFSDTFFTSALISFLPVLFLKDAVASYNFTLIFTFTTLGFFTYLFVCYLTKQEWPSIISGTLVAFSTYTVTKIMHPQLIGIQWIPLSLLFFVKFLEKKSLKYLLVTCIFFLIQTANSFLPGYFLAFCFFIISAYHFLIKKEKWQKYFSYKSLFIIGVTLFFTFLLGIPYLQVSSEFSFVRDIRDTIHFANRPEYTFYASDRTRLKSYLDEIFYKNNKGPYFYDGYLGFILFGLTFFSMYFWYKNRKKVIHPLFNSFSLIAIGSFVLSLGPAFQWGGKVIKAPFIIPLPYAFFYYFVPGFKGLRNSGRWEMLTVFALSVVIGLVLGHYMRKKSYIFNASITFLLCFFVLLEFNFPYQYYLLPKQSQFPPVYTFIKNLPEKAAIIGLPFYNWDMLPYSHIEQMRMYYSTLHFKKMVNGGSGFSPLPWQEIARKFAVEFPNSETIAYLKQIGVNYLILHRNEYLLLEEKHFTINKKPFMTWQKTEEGLTNNPNILFIKQFQDDFVYKLQ